MSRQGHEFQLQNLQVATKNVQKENDRESAMSSSTILSQSTVTRTIDNNYRPC